MVVEIQFWKGAERVFGYAFTPLDKSEVPEYFRKAIAAFYEAAPGLSLLDPEVSIRMDAPMNKDTALYG